MSAAQRDRDRHAALAVMFRAYRTYDTRSFLVDPNGPNWKPLKTAEQMGWCWFQADRCAFTAEGMCQLEPYRRHEPKPIVQWICPVCLGVVDQPADDAGLPERVSCPSCERLTRERIEEMLTEQQRSRTA